MPTTRRRRGYYRPGPVELEIERRRETMKPSEVDRAYVPGWIKPLIKSAVKQGTLPEGNLHVIAGTGWEALEHALKTYGDSWLDHAGRIKIDGHEILVSEPYAERVNDYSIGELKAFCDAFGLCYQLSANSYHYPGRTIRIMIWQP